MHAQFQNEKVICEFDLSEDQIQTHLKFILSALKDSSPFCLWLIGDVGAGKSAFVRKFLHFAGLPEHVPVTSPTFTHMNTYMIRNEKYAHFDFYRGSPKLQESIPDEFSDCRGLLVEWPEAEQQTADWLTPTHKLYIDFAPTFDKRHYRLVKS